METLTYKKAFDKITEAYIKDEIQPMDGKFCFCGTLCNNDSKWMSSKIPKKQFGYNATELMRMEAALLTPLMEMGAKREGERRARWSNGSLTVNKIGYPELYEELLFKGMSDALDVLKEIHRSRGEDVDNETVTFTKRETTFVGEFIKRPEVA